METHSNPGKCSRRPGVGRQPREQRRATVGNTTTFASQVQCVLKGRSHTPRPKRPFPIPPSIHSLYLSFTFSSIWHYVASEDTRMSEWSSGLTGTSPVVQWLRLPCTNAGGQVWYLLRKLDPTCRNYEFACRMPHTICIPAFHNEDWRSRVLQLRPAWPNK